MLIASYFEIKMTWYITLTNTKPNFQPNVIAYISTQRYVRFGTSRGWMRTLSLTKYERIYCRMATDSVLCETPQWIFSPGFLQSLYGVWTWTNRPHTAIFKIWPLDQEHRNSSMWSAFLLPPVRLPLCDDRNHQEHGAINESRQLLRSQC